MRSSGSECWPRTRHCAGVCADQLTLQRHSIRTKTVGNLASARMSVPALVRDAGEDYAQTGEPHRYMWRTDLGATEPYWRGWFAGLSNKFLSCRTAKLLLLAGADRLDRELLVAQMQGQYRPTSLMKSLLTRCCSQASTRWRSSPKLGTACRRTRLSGPQLRSCCSGRGTTERGTSSRASRRLGSCDSAATTVSSDSCAMIRVVS